MGRCITGCLCQSQAEATQATFAPFWLSLQTCHFTLPPGVVVICIYKVESLGSDEADGFALAHLVFSLGIDIGIVVKHRWPDAVSQQTFDDGRRAGGTTRVEQHLLFIMGGSECKHINGFL